MACVLSTGFTVDCRESIGGVDEFYIAELSNVASYGVVSGVVSAITMVGSTKFYKYELRKGSTEGKFDLGGDVAAGTSFITQQILLQIGNADVAKSVELRKTEKKPIVGILKEASGLFKVYGLTRGLDATTGTGSTGKAAADLNGFVITYSGEEPDYPYGISQALVTSLIA